MDSSTRVGITHRPSNTRLRVLSSKAKSRRSASSAFPSLFLMNQAPSKPWGEPCSADAVFSAQGKPNSALRVILIGTIAPSTDGWWAELVAAGSNGSVYVQALQGSSASWDKWPTIRAANPLTAISASFRKKLLAERDQARRDSRLRARFCSYRLNLPSADESTVLLTTADYREMVKRPALERVGKPIIGIDMGENRAWCAAVALFSNGLIEARALAPGIPNLSDQETRDNVARGTYQALADAGTLIQAPGLRVPRARQLIELIKTTWGRPAAIVCDHFRIEELRDAGIPCRLELRRTRWSESSYDIRSLRAKVRDGPFAIDQSSRSLMATSLAAAVVKNDDAGSVRLIKKGSNNTGRDDVANALTLAAGLYERSVERTPEAGKAFHVVV